MSEPMTHSQMVQGGYRPATDVRALVDALRQDFFIIGAERDNIIDLLRRPGPYLSKTEVEECIGRLDRAVKRADAKATLAFEASYR